MPLLLANSMNFMGFNSVRYKTSPCYSIPAICRFDCFGVQAENAGLVIPTVDTVLKQIRAQLRAAATPVSCVVVLGTTQFIRLEVKYYKLELWSQILFIFLDLNLLAYWDIGSCGPRGVSASGGTVVTDGSYIYHIFTSSGTFTMSSSSASIEYLVVAGGGGGGGGDAGGGGGAGGFRTNAQGATSGGGAAAEAAMTISAGTYQVVVGSGGAGGVGSDVDASNGGASSFNGISAAGGGGGAGWSRMTASAVCVSISEPPPVCM